MEKEFENSLPVPVQDEPSGIFQSNWVIKTIIERENTILRKRGHGKQSLKRDERHVLKGKQKGDKWRDTARGKERRTIQEEKNEKIL